MWKRQAVENVAFTTRRRSTSFPGGLQGYTLGMRSVGPRADATRMVEWC